MADIEMGTLYEANKEAYKQINPLSDKRIDKELAQIGAWMSSQYFNSYYLLYCREKHDFTIFHLKDSEYLEAVQEIKEVLETRGQILDISYSHDFEFYECWIKNIETEEISMYAFFPCEDWVIEVE